VNGDWQFVGPVYPLPPHCPHCGTAGPVEPPAGGNVDPGVDTTRVEVFANVNVPDIVGEATNVGASPEGASPANFEEGLLIGNGGSDDANGSHIYTVEVSALDEDDFVGVAQTYTVSVTIATGDDSADSVEDAAVEIATADECRVDDRARTEVKNVVGSRGSEMLPPKPVVMLSRSAKFLSS